ncbi:MAG TPA: hypothetical protein VF191_08010 [Cyclobacteriaceae bacterium]
MANVLDFARQFAEEVGGQYTEYDNSKAVIVVPLSGGRFQTVLAYTRTGGSGRDHVLFISKICDFDESIDLRDLLEKNGAFDYSRFILEDSFLKVVASCTNDNATAELVKEMIQEVANIADRFEFRFTGQDVH